MGKKLIHPPHIRQSRSCGTCEHWSWGYEGEGECDKYPRVEPWIGEKYNVRNPDFDEAHWHLSSTDICDRYRTRKSPC